MKLIAIDGLDGSGKATQAGLLCEALGARKISFPDYGSDSSALVRMYLHGDFGTDPADVNAYAASTFYAVDRYASYKRDWQQEQGLVVADRYTTSNAIHQCCKLPEAEWDTFLDWLFDLEYHRMGIPAPEMVIYLRMDPAVSQRLMEERYHGDAAKKDIHERDVAYLNRARVAADYCAERLGWRVVECCENGQVKTIETIHAEVMACVGEILR